MSWLPDSSVRRLRQVVNWPDFSGTRYSVLGEIARGGMGTVYLGRDGELDREVAIKVSNAHTGQGEIDARMGTEAAILARLEHPGIVPIHDAGRLPDGRAYYVMKRVQGRTLLEYLKDDRALNDLLGTFERICDPVAFAHARGFVHRDLKPENIMVGAFGEVLVMDWGVAKVLPEGVPLPGAVPGERPLGAPTGSEDTSSGSSTLGTPERRNTRPGTVMGTPGYMPPEQALGLVEEIDQRADVYALGAILYTMITGSSPPEIPFGDVGTLLQKQASIPKRLRAICAKACAGEAGARYPGAAELARDIARFRAGQPVDAYPETLLGRLARLAAVYKTAILLIAAYLVMRVMVALLS